MGVIRDMLFGRRVPPQPTMPTLSEVDVVGIMRRVGNHALADEMERGRARREQRPEASALTSEDGTPAGRLRALRSAALDLERRRDAQRERDYERDREQSLADREHMMGQLRPGRPGEYGGWLAGYMADGRNPTQFYRGAEPLLWVATGPKLDVRPLHGSLAFHPGVLVPAGVTCELREPGHTTLFIDNSDGRYRDWPAYFAWGFHNMMETCIPAYEDTEV